MAINRKRTVPLRKTPTKSPHQRLYKKLYGDPNDTSDKMTLNVPVVTKKQIRDWRKEGSDKYSGSAPTNSKREESADRHLFQKIMSEKFVKKEYKGKTKVLVANHCEGEMRCYVVNVDRRVGHAYTDSKDPDCHHRTVIAVVKPEPKKKGRKKASPNKTAGKLKFSRREKVNGVS